ncbi:putative mucin-associated surface protein (MASP) [Trypanosoma cruzi]|nr:putative mucin-associated surface protein (MASP) [Trypanosoma cruzi]
MRSVRASTQPRGFVRVCCGSLYKIRDNNDCVLLRLLLLPCCVLRVVPRIRHVERIPDTLIRMRTGALGLFFFSFLIIVFNYCFLLLFKLVVCGAVCELCNRTDSICLVVCALLLGCCHLLLCVAVRGVAAVSPFVFLVLSQVGSAALGDSTVCDDDWPCALRPVDSCSDAQLLVRVSEGCCDGVRVRPRVMTR